jgi:hypothetical protein
MKAKPVITSFGNLKVEKKKNSTNSKKKKKKTKGNS